MASPQFSSQGLAGMQEGGTGGLRYVILNGFITKIKQTTGTMIETLLPNTSSPC